MSTPTRITHLIAGKPWTGTAERTSEVFNPATGEVSGRARPRLGRPRRRGRRRRQGRLGRAGPTPRWPSAPRCCSSSASCSTTARRTSPRSSPPSTARSSSDALGEVTRGLEVAEFACGIPHLLKGGFTENASTKVDVYSIRQPLGVVARDLPVQLPGHGADVVLPDRHRRGNTVVIKPSEKDPSAVIAVAELWTEAGLPDGVFNVVNGDKEAVDALLTHPDIKARLVRRLHPDRSVRLRDRHRARQAGPGPRRRQEPHARAARRRPRPRRRRGRQRRASVPRASGAWRSRRWSRSSPSPTSSSRRSRTGWASCAPVTAPRAATWARSSPRPTATRWPATSTRACSRARPWSSTAATASSTVARTATCSAPRCSTTSTRT